MKKFNLTLVGIILISLAACSSAKTNVPLSTQTSITEISSQTTFPATQTPIKENGWWNRSIFYEIFVRSFYDSNGDGIGDLQGINDKLDYLNDGDPQTNTDLEINAIWLMPIFPAASYHGYDVTDYLNVNPDYGTLDDFKQLLANAHERGIKVIIDMVINHTSDKHPWFLAALDPNSPYHDYYIWSKTDPGYLGPSSQKVWHVAAMVNIITAFLMPALPDLNLCNPKVTEEIQKIIRFWMIDIGVDGFRMDGIRHFIEDGKSQVNTIETHQWLKDFHTFYKSLNPAAVTVGEVWDSSSVVEKYVQGDEMDLAFNFDLEQAFVQSAAERSSFATDMILTNDLPGFQNGLSMATFLSNHDQNRSFNSFNGMVEKAKNAVALLLTSPGVPLFIMERKLA